MMFKGPNGKMCSTLSGPELIALNNTEEFIENCKEVAETTGNIDLFTEMFGEGSSPMDSAFMDDNFGG